MTFAAILLFALQNAPPPPPVRVFDPIYESAVTTAAARAAAAMEPGSIDGIVVEAASGRPIPRATVQLQSQGAVVAAGPRGGTPTTNASVVTLTRDDGSFSFKTVNPGPISLQAELAGYIPESYGLSTESLRITPPMLQPGQKLSRVRLALTRGAVISGRLIDDRGEAVAGAAVQAMKTIYRSGLRERQVVQSVASNDLGEFRLFMLRPGEYHVSVQIGKRGQALPFFFPGTIDAKASQALELREGETMANVNFQSVPTRTRRVTGTVQGHGGDGVGVILSPVNGTVPIQQTLDQTSGTFQFTDVAPGAYTLVARTAEIRSSISIDVRNADMLNMRIGLAPGFRIPVRVRIEGRPPGDDPELENLYFIARPEIVVPGLEGETYSPFANGRFSLELLPGLHRLDITRPEGAYVRSMTLGGVDVLNSGLNVTNSTDQALEVVVAFDSGTLQGRTERPNATVVLVPDTSRRAVRWLYRSMTVGPGGEFRFEKVPPGDYKLFAWTGDGGPWLEPEYLARYEDRGVPVHIDADKRTVAAQAIPVN